MLQSSVGSAAASASRRYRKCVFRMCSFKPLALRAGVRRRDRRRRSGERSVSISESPVAPGRVLVSDLSDLISARNSRSRLLTNTATHARMLTYTAPAIMSRCSAKSALTQSITARTQAERRRSRWTMIQYSGRDFGDRRCQPLEQGMAVADIAR